MTEKQLHDILDNIREQRWHSVALSFSMPVIEVLLWSVQKFSVLSYARTIKFTQILFSISPFPIKAIRMINGYFPWAAEKQPLEVFYKKSVFKHFTKFTGKHSYNALFFNKAARTTFHTDHLQVTASEQQKRLEDLTLSLSTLF